MPSLYFATISDLPILGLGTKYKRLQQFYSKPPPAVPQILAILRIFVIIYTILPSRQRRQMLPALLLSSLNKYSYWAELKNVKLRFLFAESFFSKYDKRCKNEQVLHVFRLRRYIFVFLVPSVYTCLINSTQ